MKGIFLQNLKVSNEKTSTIASKAIRRNIYGAGHPYGSSIEERDLENLNASDFAEFFLSQFKIKDIFICGDLDDSDLSFIKAEFNFICGAQTQNKIPFGATLPFQQHIEKSSIQSSIRLGKRSVLKSDPNYFTTLILNHLLGGFFGSRLMKNIREEKGLTYGIHSSIHGLKNDSFFIIEADVNKENLTIALSEIRKEIRKLSEEKTTSDELDLAKNHFIGSLQSELANPFAIIEKIKNIQLNTLPSEYYQNLVQHINNLTTNDIQLVAQTFLKEESFFEVSVGS
jgi:predicted Zn-dependent peptidase